MSTETEQVTKKVNATKIVEPQFLTLTKKPANQVGFKIVRNQEQAMTEQSDSSRVKRVRAKRSMGPMLSVLFPAGTTEDEAHKLMEEYGLTDYTLSTSGDTVVALRSDLDKPPTDTVDIGIGNGLKAQIMRTALVTKPTDPAPYVAVSAVRFDVGSFSGEADALAWLEKHDVDFLEGGIKNDGTSIVVTRAEVGEDADTKEVCIGDGVTVRVVRADVQDIPSSIVEVVSEAAYGNWGWGQLDFAAAVADVEYSELAQEGLYRLSDVLRNIMFYSPLPVSVRKELVNRAMTQFGAYIGTLLDALPGKVVMINRSILESKEKQMSNKQETQNVVDVTRSEGTAPPAQTESQPEYVTRSELTALVADAVKTAMAEVQRSEVKPEAKPDADAGKTDDGLSAVTRSLESLGKVVEKLGESVAQRLDKIESTTVVRSDSGDGKQKQVERADVFKGIFSPRAQ